MKDAGDLENRSINVEFYLLECCSFPCLSAALSF